MSIILSHQTARAFHDLPNAPRGLPTSPSRPASLQHAAPDKQLVADARSALAALGIDSDDPLHVIVGDRNQRRHLDGLVCHLHTNPLPAGSLLQLGEQIFVCDIRLCALQAATYLPELELIEYLYQVCGSYVPPASAGGELLEREPPTTVEELRRYAESTGRAPGCQALKRVLPWVREGTRSPMETAFIMLLALPKRLGGLGLRSLKVNYRVEVTQAARPLTRRSHFYFDAFIPATKTDVEYNGFYHNESVQRAIDEERHNALSSMGYNILDVSKHSLLDRASFLRCMKKVMRQAEIRPSRLPANFAQEQEKLRRFVLRRWL